MQAHTCTNRVNKNVTESGNNNQNKQKKYNFNISRCTKDSRNGIAVAKKETKLAA